MRNALGLLVAFVMLASAASAQVAGPGVLPGTRGLSAGGAFTSPLFGTKSTDCAAPVFSFSGDTDTGFTSNAADTWILCAAGIAQMTGSATGLDLWPQAGGTTQAIHLYEQFNTTPNYTRGMIDWSSGRFEIGTEKGSGGSSVARVMEFITDGTRQWQIDTSGNFIAPNDNAKDIGASGATRPRTMYLGTSLISPVVLAGDGSASAPGLSFSAETDLGFARISGNVISVVNGTVDTYRIDPSSGGSISPAAVRDNLVDLGVTGTQRWRSGYLGTSLNVGTNPSSTGAVALANNAAINFRNAANSGDLLGMQVDSSNTGQLFTGVPFSIGSASFAGTINASTLTLPTKIQLTSFTFANIGTTLTANGMIGYCSDCVIANPCAGSGTGALAKRLNGVNVCN